MGLRDIFIMNEWVQRPPLAQTTRYMHHHRLLGVSLHDMKTPLGCCQLRQLFDVDQMRRKQTKSISAPNVANAYLSLLFSGRDTKHVGSHQQDKHRCFSNNTISRCLSIRTKLGATRELRTSHCPRPRNSAVYHPEDDRYLQLPCNFGARQVKRTAANPSVQQIGKDGRVVLKTRLSVNL